MSKKLFLSTVSSEFAEYRKLLTTDLKRPDLDVAVQEDFIATGGSTLEKLDDYIRHCDGIIHLIGKATGAVPEEHAVAALLARYRDFAAKLPPLAALLAQPQPGFSYTQWEAYLAIYHQRPLFIYRPTDFDLDALNVPRDARFVWSADEERSQKEHYARISALGHDRGQFLNEERLSSAVLRDLVEILPRLAGAVKADISRILRYAPAELIGREKETQLLQDTWTACLQVSSSPRPHILTFVALGGEGKTSLVAKWAADLAAQDWLGCDAVFAWSFYSQGTREQTAVSSDLFLAEALAFFGDEAMATSAQGAYEKGKRLAQLIGERRALLILDGLEPLQYAPTSPTPGELKDQGVSALLEGLAASSHGLCVVTTRYALPDLRAFHGKTVREEKLLRLNKEAGVALLRSFEVKGTPAEYERLVEDVKGQALTLNLLGSYLRDAHAGDIRKRDLIRLEEADAEDQGGHAFRVMDAYVASLEGRLESRLQAEPSGGPVKAGTPNGQRAVAILRLMGLFDRPATADCLRALWSGEAIADLTEPLHGITEAQRNMALKRLEDARLLTVNRDAAGTLLSLDAHPLIREYFAVCVRSSVRSSGFSRSPVPDETGTQPPKGGTPNETSPAWKAAHRRLYEHLCATTKDLPAPKLEDLLPLYQAVAHGCHAGLQEVACEQVYGARILRGREFYTVKKLGAFGFDLGAIVCFFDIPWSRVSSALTEMLQAWMLNEAATRLLGLGRLTEALEPMRAGLRMRLEQEQWEQIAISASNLSELELSLGEVMASVRSAEMSVNSADRSGVAFQRLARRAAYADALHQAGQRKKAETLFNDAEQIHVKRQPDYPLLYSLPGFRYCDLLLAEAEREAWRLFLEFRFRAADRTAKAGTPNESCSAVSERAAQTLKWMQADSTAGIIDIALNYLTLGRSALYAAILEQSPLDNARSAIESAVSSLRDAGTTHHIPRGLLTRAWLRALTGVLTGPASAQSDLDDAWEIAERGPMLLHMADIHLSRCRLFEMPNVECRMSKTPYPWESPAHDLAEARRLILKHGYLRRLPELEDAEAAAARINQ